MVSSDDWLLGRFNFTLIRLVAPGAPGAYEPSKAVKEHATAVYVQVPSKYKIEPATVSILEKCASIRDRCDTMKCTTYGMHA